MPSKHCMCALDPETETNLKIFLFKDVNNVETIRNNVVKGKWKCAVLNPSLILDIFQVIVAANRAVASKKFFTITTKNIYSEILYNLSLSKNVSQSLSKFGVGNDNNLLICFLINYEDDMSEEIIKQIEGQICPISELSKFSNLNNIKSEYKLDNVNSEDFLDVIVSRIATKGL